MNILVSISYSISLCLLTWCIVKFKNLAKYLICLSYNWFWFCKVCKLSLILEMLLALEYTLHPSIQVRIPTLFMWVRLLCKEGLILFKAFRNSSRKFSSDGVSDQV